MIKKLKSTTRVQIELPEKSMARLTLLKEVTESASYSEVMKNALRLYENLINQHELGAEVLLREKDGTLIKYEIFG